MASIFSLPEECLCKVVSYIYDLRTFYSVALTCKRFLQVTRSTRSALHPDLLMMKACYFLRRYIVEIDDNEEKHDTLRKLVCECAQLTKAKELITYDKVIGLWKTNGPVAATLLTWVRSQRDGDEEFYRDDWDGSVASYKNQTLTLQLPSSRQTVMIETEYVEEHPVEVDSKIRMIHVTTDDLNVMFTGPLHCWSSVSFHERDGHEPQCMDCDDLDDNVHLSKHSDKLASLRPVIKLLQKELGETVPLITNYFFIWLCYFFPDKLNLYEENKLIFKDDSRNRKPSYASIQHCIDEYHKGLNFESNFEMLFTEWENGESQESNNASKTAETIRLLAQRSQVESLQSLRRDFFQAD